MALNLLNSDQQSTTEGSTDDLCFLWFVANEDCELTWFMHLAILVVAVVILAGIVTGCICGLRAYRRRQTLSRQRESTLSVISGAGYFDANGDPTHVIDAVMIETPKFFHHQQLPTYDEVMSENVVRDSDVSFEHTNEVERTM